MQAIHRRPVAEVAVSTDHQDPARPWPWPNQQMCPVEMSKAPLGIAWYYHYQALRRYDLKPFFGRCRKHWGGNAGTTQLLGVGGACSCIRYPISAKLMVGNQFGGTEEHPGSPGGSDNSWSYDPTDLPGSSGHSFIELSDFFFGVNLFIQLGITVAKNLTQLQTSSPPQVLPRSVDRPQLCASLHMG